VSSVTNTLPSCAGTQTLTMSFPLRAVCLQELLTGFAKETLRTQPANIYKFGEFCNTQHTRTHTHTHTHTRRQVLALSIAVCAIMPSSA